MRLPTILLPDYKPFQFFSCGSPFRDYARYFFCILSVVINHKFPEKKTQLPREERENFFLKPFFYGLDDPVGGLGKKLKTLNLSLLRF
jgi:hypothetical protein